MKVAAPPPNEAERLASLSAHDILDTPPEQGFDDLTALASHICGTPIALVSLVDAHRQWFKSRVGLAAAETPRDVAFCAHTILGDGMMVVQDAFEDERFHDNPLVTGAPHVRFYAGAPLKARDGHALGTLCIIDHVPRRLSDSQHGALARLGRQVEAQLQLRLRLREAEQREAESRSQRDTLARVQAQKDELLHLVMRDFQVPLSTIQSSASLMLGHGQPPEVRGTAREIREASEGLRRMVANLLDASHEESPLVPRLEEFEVTALLGEVARDFSLRIQGSRRQFLQAVRLPEPRVLADRELLRRTLENLLDNSFRFTALGSGRVALEASQPEPGLLEVRVRDEGPGIPAAARAHVFDSHVPEGAPTAARARAGNSVGLSFCRRAVQAHGGWIWVEDNAPRGTCFCLRVPLRPALARAHPAA